MATPEITPDLLNWADIKDQGWSGILIGNGSSRAVWDAFKYGSLLEKAKSQAIPHPLAPQDLQVFTGFGTENFERVLSALSTSIVVGHSYGQDTQFLEARYGAIRSALVEAVHAVHVPWNTLTDEIRIIMRDELLNYSFVYSTNYDLLIYWAIMQDDAIGFKDYFWNSGAFSLSNVEVWDKCTRVLYLHGGLHLSKLPSGQTIKRIAGLTNLLDSFGTDQEGATPLFISEGTSNDKLRSIYNSDYLAFAYNQFLHHEGKLVIFGHSLGNADAHLISAARQHSSRSAAVSVVPGNDSEIIEAKARYKHYLPETELLFFNAFTHPLGSSALNVTPATLSVNP